jgi:hypothetical protein
MRKQQLRKDVSLSKGMRQVACRFMLTALPFPDGNLPAAVAILDHSDTFLEEKKTKIGCFKKQK